IFAQIKKKPSDITAYNDLFSLCRNIEGENFELSHRTNGQLKTLVGKAMKSTDSVSELFSVYKKCLLFDAPHSFDSYLLYLEINRKPNERFYQPRRKVLKQVVDALQELADDKLDELFISMPPRVGKLLSDDTPVLTTKGWKKHGDLVVGDMVFNPEGIPIPVLGVMPKYHTTHTVTFSDGSKIDCHFRHEWKVYDRRFGKVRLLETQEMIGHLENGKQFGHSRGHRYNFMIENRSAIEGIPVDLKVKPYTLGAWLGDGTNRQPRITGVDEEIIQSIIADGYKEKHRYIHKDTGVVTVEFDGLKSALANYGMCRKERTEKYIPDEYIIANVEDRLELLAGLLDTDGCLRIKENRYNFTTSELRLKETFIDLIHTFGWRVYVREIAPHTSSSGIVGKRKYWEISFNPNEYIPCRLSRKQLKAFSKARRLSIISIEPSEPKQGNCITVLGGMYLAGRNMIPTHNTTILMFFVTWLIGRNSEASNLYSAYSDVITKAFYNGVLEIINDPVTYLWKDVFPDAKIVQTNSQDETLNIDRKKRYPSLTCRSLYGTLNGACDCNGFEISDDLIGGIEEALNKDRLTAAWSKVDNNLLPRAKEKAKILWCGTRWSMIDPAGLRMELLQNDERFKNRRYKIINLSALDENDESQFYYDYGVGFSTEYYLQRRASFERNNDMASWLAQYMGEPIERDGALFSPDDFRYYNGELPFGEPDRIYMPVDPAFGGGDYVSGPVCFEYGEDIYVHDVVFDNGDKRVTQPLIVKAVLDYQIQAMQIEATKSTESYKDKIAGELKKHNVRINLTTKPAPTNKSKNQRIFDKAPDIRERMIFRESGKRSKPYSLFMQNVFSYKMLGKNKNDDAPDSLAMAIDMSKPATKQCIVFKRTL
ncbi:MAG: LAGLIDADG family homing endonuclease, partial [Acutalibacteraceae bacterium]